MDPRRTLVAFLTLAFLAAPTAGAVTREIEVVLHEYSGGLHVIPETINANVGDTLVLTVVNQGASQHNLRVCADQPPKPSIDCGESWGQTRYDMQANETAPLQVEVKRSGTFEYYCYVPGHKGAGMRGELHVASDAAEAKSIPGAPLAGILALLGTLIFLGGRRR
jgi:uncharacterized cupredoxin-like copper-binding protein